MTFSRSVLLVSAGILLAACGGSDEAESGSSESSAKTSTTESESGSETTETATVAEENVEEGKIDSQEVELAEVDESGISGTVELSGEEGRLSLVVELDEGYEDTHGLEARKGSCDDVVDPGAVDTVLAEVATYTLPDIEDGSMETDEPLPEDVVAEGTYALVAYDGADLDGDVAACAQVEVE